MFNTLGTKLPVSDVPPFSEAQILCFDAQALKDPNFLIAALY